MIPKESKCAGCDRSVFDGSEFCSSCRDGATMSDQRTRIRELEEAVRVLAKMVFVSRYEGFDVRWVQGQIDGIKNPIAKAAVDAARKESP